MCNDNGWGHGDASEQQRRQIAQTVVDDALAKLRPKLVDAVASFLTQAISPTALFELEILLVVLFRELGRLLMQATLQALEPADPKFLPRDLYFHCGGYTRRNEQTRNANIATIFGSIVLWRRGYRSWHGGHESIIPLELMLGFTQGITPGLVDFIGRTHAAAGMSQRATLKVLKQQCGVSIGVKRLRDCLEQLSDDLEPLRQVHQVDQLLSWLEKAKGSRGNRKPVLSVGRDGITLRDHATQVYSVATAATVSIYDRAGKRLGTIYLAYPPELGQATMDKMLTDLLGELFRRFAGPLPRLAYVTDSGSNETDYYQRVLRKMKHPLSGTTLDWQRVADFYHVSERVWATAGALFKSNEQQKANAWARRMLKALKKSSGASRVLHAAASLYHRRKLGVKRRTNFWKAYEYLRKRTAYARYAEFKNLHIPLGSGVTEAACKTVYTQRLKLSGMSWSDEGAVRILTLRTILLSGTWEATFRSYLQDCQSVAIRPYTTEGKKTKPIAA